MDSPITRAEHNEFAKRMEEEHHRQNRRIGELEKACEENNKLLVSVERLALSMENMQKENPNKEQATNSMCTFLAMNTAGFQIVPAVVIAILSANGMSNPTQIIIPTLIVTTIAFISAIFFAKALERVFK